MASSLAVASPAGPQCTSRLDCELNGECVSGVCQCSTGWVGPSCGTLDLLPASRTAGYRRPGWSSWGGSVTQAVDGAWVMYAAEMDLQCGLGTWSTNSRIIRAEAEDAGGEYRLTEVVKPRFAHEPTVLGPTADGQYLLFHVGAGRGSWRQNRNPPCTACLNGSTPASCKNLSYPHGSPAFVAATVLWAAPTARGPWREVGVVQTPDGPRDGYSDSNPAAVLFPNGSLLMMWRSAGCACSPQCPGLAEPLPQACLTNEPHSCWQSRLHLGRAAHWADVSTYVFEPETLFPCGTAPNLAERGAEDPYIFWAPDPAPGLGGSFHAVLHRNRCKGGVGCLPSISGQHAYSADGRRWHLSAADAYNGTVLYTDGGTELLGSRERPHLILDPRTGRPTHLVTGATLVGEHDRAITHIQPIRTGDTPAVAATAGRTET